MKHYLGIDIGGTAVKLGIVDEAGAVLAKAEESVSFDGYRTPILTTVLKAANAFAAQSVLAESLAGIGVSATGQIDSRTEGHRGGHLRQPAQLHRRTHQGGAGKRPLVCRSR